LLGAPVVTEGVASTCSFPFSHPLYIGSFPRLAPPIRAFLMRYDLLCSIGGDLFTLSLPSDVEPMPDGLDVIHIDVDPWEIGKNYAASIGIQGDPKATLPELSEAVRRHTSKTGHPQAARRREAAPAPRPRPLGPPSPRKRSRQPPVCVTSSGARIPRASSACAAAASAGACRRRSASSSRCPIARSSR